MSDSHIYQKHFSSDEQCIGLKQAPNMPSYLAVIQDFDVSLTDRN